MAKQKRRTDQSGREQNEQSDRPLNQGQEKNRRLRNPVLMQQYRPGHTLTEDVEQHHSRDDAVDVGAKYLRARCANSIVREQEMEANRTQVLGQHEQRDAREDRRDSDSVERAADIVKIDERQQANEDRNRASKFERAGLPTMCWRFLQNKKLMAIGNSPSRRRPTHRMNAFHPIAFSPPPFTAPGPPSQSYTVTPPPHTTLPY